MIRIKNYIDSFLTWVYNTKHTEEALNFLFGYFMSSFLLYIMGGLPSIIIIISFICCKNAYNIITDRMEPNFKSAPWVVVGAILAFLIDYCWMLYYGMNVSVIV